MFSKTERLEVHRSLAVRLTLWYAVIFAVTACAAFYLFYLFISNTIRSQTDMDLVSDVQALDSIMRLQGVEAAKRQAVLQSQAAGEKKLFFRFLSADGRVFSSSNIAHWQNIETSRAAIRHLIAGGAPVFDTIRLPQRPNEVRVLYALVGPGIIIQLGRSLEHYSRIVETFRRTFVLTMALLLIFAAGAGWFMARRALSGVQTVTATARRIAGGRLEERVPVKKRGDEIDQLAITFNAMLDRIGELLTGIRDMSDNMAHDLKGPVTRIRGLAEVTLTTSPGVEEYEKMAGSTIEECDRLLDMINTLLLISKTRAEAEAGSLAREPLNLAGLVRSACDLYQSPAEDRDIQLACSLPEHLQFHGDTRLLQRMVANLLDNAVKYTPAGGRIEVELTTGIEGQPELRVQDNGCGIASDELPHIFKRFYRSDPSRTTSGTGLGLSFCRTVARAHGGEIRAENRPGGGSRFTVTLPTWRPQDPPRPALPASAA
jgi:heavy metal sensor kinase